jgi:hypothetical protein
MSLTGDSPVNARFPTVLTTIAVRKSAWKSLHPHVIAWVPGCGQYRPRPYVTRIHFMPGSVK